MAYSKFRPAGLGGWPIFPAATCTFCSRRAARTSSVVRLRDLSWSGFNQMRIPKSLLPIELTSPTPATRARTSFTRVVE